MAADLDDAQPLVVGHAAAALASKVGVRLAPAEIEALVEAKAELRLER